ncbi:MAG: GWxTD domain-containing protein [Bacteroidota bacterium]|nr:GWxTD domain-containing protein [Bacteroidota bacterium]
MSRAALLVWCVALLGPVGWVAQEPLGLPGRYFLGQFGEGWFAELYVFPDGDSLRAIVLTRVTHAALVFEQEPRREGFHAMVHLSMEFIDTLGIVRRRLDLRDTVWARYYETTLARDSWSRGVEVRIPMSVSRCRLQLFSSQREARQQELPIRVIQGVPQWTTPLLVQAEADTAYVPFVLGAALPFGRSQVRCLLWDSRLKAGATYTYSCRQMPPEAGERWWDSTPELRGNAYAERGGRLELHPQLVPQPGFRFRPDPLPVGAWVEVYLPTAALVPGRYEMALVKADTASPDTLRYSFRVVWTAMPVSLRRISYALQSMYYILPDKEWERFRGGSAQEQWERVWRYWKQRDPTPATAYNEAMAAYFRRVDHAYFAFQSATEPDGMRTERGKIYILYGEPTRVEREFPSGRASREVWVYERFRQRFLFELRPDGRWRLASVEQL